VNTRRPAPGGEERLRRSAEARLARDAPPAPEASPRELLHELQVHQVELELQNEELRRAQLELEAARDQYRELYDFAPVGYLAIDAGGCLTGINLAGAAMLGRDRAELVSRRFTSYVAPRDQPRWEHHFMQARTAPALQLIELQVEPFGRKPFPAQLICRTSAPGADGPSGLRVALLDITDRRRAEEELQRRHTEEELQRRVEEQLRSSEQLRKTQLMLLQADKLAAIGQLAAGVAHEINNPLTYVKSNVCMTEERAAELLTVLEGTWKAVEVCAATCPQAQQLRTLREGFDLEWARRDLKEMMAESLEGLTRVAGLIHDLRDFAHPDAGGVEEADLRTVIERALRVLEATTAGQARVVRSWGADVPPLRCRPSQLDQVFMNLLLNALQSGRPGVTVTVRTGRAGDEVWAEVEDDGPGIPDGNLDRVFEPFFTTKPIGEGTGLGLSVAHGIVRGHGGHIELRSRVGAGSTFRVVLPIAGPPDVVAPLPIPPGASRYEA
jgi:PAS domain S-box-containing protein